MSKSFEPSFTTDDIIQFESIENPLEVETIQPEVEINQLENSDVPESAPELYRSPSTYGFENPQFHPKRKISYIVKSVTWDKFHTSYYMKFKYR